LRWSYYGSQTPESQLDDFLSQPPSLVAVDVETVSDRDLTPVGLSIATSRDEAFYWPIDSPELPWYVLQDPGITKIYHNALFDMEALSKLWLNPDRNIDIENIDDTIAMARLLNMPRALSNLAPRYGSYARSMKEVMGRGRKTTEHLSQEIIGRKCCEDTTATFAVYEELKELVDKKYYRMETDIIPILLSMTLRGVAVDQNIRGVLQEELERDVEYYKLLADEYDFNPGSPQQVAYTLSKHKVFLPMIRGKLTTKASELEKLDHPIAALVLNYRSASKNLSTYVRPLEGLDRTHSRFHANAVTGRISSTRPNMQNIPHTLRNMYKPDGDVFTDFDYSQIELRFLAYLSGDRIMQGVYDMGGDIHQATADAMGIRRSVAKNTNFAIIYGATGATVAETAGVSLKRGQQMLESWFRAYPTAGRWIWETQKVAISQGYVETLGGRKLVLPVDEPEGKLIRKPVNWKIQGSAAEVMKRSMIACRKLPISLQIYDQLLIQGRVELPEGLDRLSSVYTPIDVRETERWE